METETLVKQADRRAFLWVLLLVVVSGSPVFNNSVVVKFLLPLVTTFAVASTFLSWRSQFLNRLLLVILPFAFVFLVQYVEFGLFEAAYISTILKVVLGAVVAYRVGERFIPAFVEVMYYIALMSFIFYAAQLVLGSDSFPDLIETFAPGGNQKSVLFHTVVVNDSFRNASLFWEPGAFQGFIILALALATLSALLRSVEGRRRLIVLCAALATTQSTAGVVVLLALLVVEVMASKLSHSIKVGAILMIIASGALAYFGLEFVGQKIALQLEEAADLSEYYGDRFRGLVLDWSYIKERPLTGNGFAEEIRWRLHPDLQGRNLGHGNGFSGFIVNVGLIGFAAFVVGVLTAPAPFDGVGRRLLFLLVIIVLLQSQHFLGLAFFWSICFLGFWKIGDSFVEVHSDTRRNNIS